MKFRFRDMETWTSEQYRKYSAKRKSKYRNKKTKVDDIEFDSQAEASRYLMLKKELETGCIEDLELQPVFVLQEAFVDWTGKKQRAAKYVADFKYLRDGDIVVEDVKGHQTEKSKLQVKLFLKKYPHIKFFIIKE